MPYPSPSLFPSADDDADLLASMEDVKSYLHTAGIVSPGAQIDDGLLNAMLRAASDRMRDAASDRTLSPIPPSSSDDPVARSFRAARNLIVPDLRELVALELDGREIPTTDVVLRGRPGQPAQRLRFKYGEPWGYGLVITGHWGPETIKPSVSEAVVVWVARVFHQRTNRFADNASAPDGSSLGYFRNLPPDVKLVLDNLQVPGL